MYSNSSLLIRFIHLTWKFLKLHNLKHYKYQSRQYPMFIQIYLNVSSWLYNVNDYELLSMIVVSLYRFCLSCARTHIGITFFIVVRSLHIIWKSYGTLFVSKGNYTYCFCHLRRVNICWHAYITTSPMDN